MGTSALFRAKESLGSFARQRRAAGAEVTVEDFSFWHGSFCVRETGNPDCYWVPEKVLITTVAKQKELEAKKSPDEGLEGNRPTPTVSTCDRFRRRLETADSAPKLPE